MNKLPIFTTAYSFKSILTPKDIARISKEKKIERPFIIEDNMVSFFYFQGLLENFAYGIKFFVCNNVKNNEGKSFHRLNVIAKNKEGYKSLLALYGAANENSVKNRPYIDLDVLNRFWSGDLILAVPFYNSYLHKNLHYGEDFMCDLKAFNPVYFLEENGLFFEEMIKEQVQDLEVQTQEVQSVYYETHEDFLAWQTYICIQNRTVLTNPKIERCNSDRFNLENCYA